MQTRSSWLSLQAELQSTYFSNRRGTKKINKSKSGSSSRSSNKMVKPCQIQKSLAKFTYLRKKRRCQMNRPEERKRSERSMKKPRCSISFQRSRKMRGQLRTTDRKLTWQMGSKIRATRLREISRNLSQRRRSRTTFSESITPGVSSLMSTVQQSSRAISFYLKITRTTQSSANG